MMPPTRKFRRDLIGATLLLLLAALPVFSQTPEEFKKKYQQLDETHYLIRADVVFYAEFVGAQLCKMVIEPKSIFDASKRSNGIKDLPGNIMPEKAAEEVIDELAPAAGRGRLIHSGSFESSCNQVSMEEYENISVSRTFHRCQKERGEVVAVTIRAKEAKCGWKRR